MSFDPAQIRQKALLAASTVVFAFSMPGCVPTTGHPKTDTSGDSVSDTASADTSTSDTSTSDTSTSDTARDTSSGDTSTHDSSDTASTGDGRPDCTAVPAEDVNECCSALAEWCYANVAPEDRSDCYLGPDFDGSTGCSPWGPPAPPRLRQATA